MSDQPTAISLDFLGYKAEDFESDDQLKEQFQKDYIKKSNIEKDKELRDGIMGKAMGSIQTSAKQFAKELGIEVSGEEYDGLNIQDKYKFITTNALSAKNTEIEEIKASSNSTNDEKVVEWETKYNTLKNTSTEKITHLEDTVSTINGEFDQYKTTIQQNSLKSSKDNYWSASKSKVDFKSGMSEMESKGFDAIMRDKYQFLQDENDTFYPATMDGKMISNPDKAGDFYDMDNFHTLLSKDAQDSNLLKLNPNEGQPTQGNGMFGKSNQEQLPPTGSKGRKINMNARNRFGASTK